MSMLEKWLQVSNEEHGEPRKVEVEVEVEVEIPEVQPVSEEEEYEADEHLAEVEDERREYDVAVEQYEMMVREVEEHIASIENFTEVLEFGLEKAQFSPQYAGACQAQLDRYKTLFGESLDVPALEGYTHENLGEYYGVALEGFKEVVGKLTSSVNAAYNKLSSEIKAIGTNEKAAAALTKKADAALEKLAAADFSEAVEVPLGNLAYVFTHKGQLVADPVKAIAADQRALAVLYKSYIPAAGKYAEQLIDGVAATINDRNRAADQAEKALAIKHPRLSIATAVADGSMLIGDQVVLPKASDKKTNEDALKETRSEIKGTLFDDQDHGDLKGKSFTLTKGQVEGLLRGVKVYAEQLKQAGTEIKKELANQRKALEKINKLPKAETRQYYTLGTGIIPTKSKAPSKDALGKQMRALSSLASRAVKEPLAAFKEISNQIESNARFTLKLANRAIDKAGKSKKEETSVSAEA